MASFEYFVHFISSCRRAVHEGVQFAGAREHSLWAFATVGHQEEQLFTSLAAAAAERRMRDFNPQDLANTAWAFATVGHQEKQLFTSLAAAAERRMKEFNSQELVNTA